MKKGFLSILIAGAAVVASAQSADPIVMKVGNEQVPLSEFEAIFMKNHPKDKPVLKDSLDTYAVLFANFKLKVQAAKAAGIDTLASFRNEFNGYKRQLGQPYLKEKAKEDQLLDEALERSKTDLRVSHIVVKKKNDCMSPADTAELYKKALDIRKRLAKEDFAKVAAEVSDDNYSKVNGGDLGWFSGLMWAYPFESAAFKLKKGEISQPVRTNMGYHIIKVDDVRPARGEVQVAHVFVGLNSKTTEERAKAEQKANEAYAALQAGAAWEDVVTKYSEDKNSATKGGEMPAFGLGKMVQEFEDASFALKNVGDYSKPVLSQYGYHIIRLLSKNEKGASAREEYRKILQKDARYKLVAESFVEKTKKELGYAENTALVNKIKALEKNGEIQISELEALPDETFITLAGKQYSFSDFRTYTGNRLPKGVTSYCNLETKYFKPYVEQKVMEAAEQNLENKYPDYKALLKEYREGIMIFEMMDKKVWSKSVEDTVGLKGFFEQNRDRYTWGPRTSAYRVIGTDSATLVKVKKEAEKVLAGKKPVTYLTDKFNKKQVVVIFDEEKKEAGESKELDAFKGQPQLGNISKSKENWYFYIVNGVVGSEPKALKEAKGLVISDYQTYLETTWLNELRSQYPVTVDKAVMYKLAK